MSMLLGAGDDRGLTVCGCGLSTRQSTAGVGGLVSQAGRQVGWLHCTLDNVVQTRTALIAKVSAYVFFFVSPLREQPCAWPLRGRAAPRRTFLVDVSGASFAEVRRSIGMEGQEQVRNAFGGLAPALDGRRVSCSGARRREASLTQPGSRSILPQQPCLFDPLVGGS